MSASMSAGKSAQGDKKTQGRNGNKYATEKKQRRNGFQHPLNDLQIATWFLYPFILAGFYVLILPVLEFYLQIACGLIYFILHMSSGVSAYLVSKIDPADPHLACTDKYMTEVMKLDDAGITKVKESSVFQLRQAEMKCMGPRCDTHEGIVHCYYCKTAVSKLSKHCKFCDKCVHVFDHHCKWLNNCVGARNYRYFVAVVTFTLCFTSFHLAFCAYVIWRYFDPSESQDFRDLVTRRLMMHEVYIALIFFYTCALVPIVILIAQLFQFHMTLIYLDVTTYEYVSNATNRQKKTPRKRPVPKPKTPTKSLELTTLKKDTRPTKKNSNKLEKVSGATTVNSDLLEKSPLEIGV